jgi:hypothetical protein
VNLKMNFLSLSLGPPWIQFKTSGAFILSNIRLILVRGLEFFCFFFYFETSRLYLWLVGPLYSEVSQNEIFDFGIHKNSLKAEK